MTLEMATADIELVIEDQGLAGHVASALRCLLDGRYEVVDYHREKCFKYAGAPPQSAPSPQRACSVRRSRARPAAEQRCNGSSS